MSRPAHGVLLFLVFLALSASAHASKCTAYCVCNGISSEACKKKEGDCTSPAMALCQGADCGAVAVCCCSEQVLQDGTLVLKVTDCLTARRCLEMCGSGSFLVHGDEEPGSLIQSVMNPEERSRRARLGDWALVEVEMLEGREVLYHPIYGSSNRYAVDAAQTSGIDNFMSPGQSTRILVHEGPPGAIGRNPTVDQDGLRAHLLEVLGDRFLELEGAKTALTIVRGLHGQVESIQVLYSEPEEFAKILVPELRKAYPTYSEHEGNGRTMDVFSPNIHTEGQMLGLHFGGSYLLDVHPLDRD